MVWSPQGSERRPDGVKPYPHKRAASAATSLVSKLNSSFALSTWVPIVMLMMEKWLWLGLGVTAVGFLAGLVYPTVSAAMDRQQYPPPGQLVDLGGLRLHLHCLGQGTPTVVMDVGAGAPAITWGLVPAAIAQFTRVCL
ncbi:hypothetical protein H6F86_12155 [Phormidium sp. FACHB-592]|uniref:Uncharacterized protein n=1 Tax=Stenomitos frigidus AS-A4 TaxID=2933935 RepID=A0ABV0KS03_9CYAN|nr:hypothetical protein [Phormidium sp. FACHB-592]MBD2074627.1 hypothetical protein [Phormidium sp. FACHB-592]